MSSDNEKIKSVIGIILFIIFGILFYGFIIGTVTSGDPSFGIKLASTGVKDFFNVLLGVGIMIGILFLILKK